MRRSLISAVVVLAAASVIGGCATPDRAATTTAKPPPRAPAQAPADWTPPADIMAAREAVAQAKLQSPDWTEADYLLAKAEAAARNGNTMRAQSLAKQVAARARAQQQTQAIVDARKLLARVRQRTGLNQVQLTALRTAELALVRGQGRRALELLRKIDSAAAIATRLYTVQPGDSLWTIAAKPSVYGNAWLWPLIWRANLDLITDPAVLRAGMDLDIRTNPTVEEVYSAVQEARGRAGKVDVGTVRPAK